MTSRGTASGTLLLIAVTVAMVDAIPSGYARPSMIAKEGNGGRGYNGARRPDAGGARATEVSSSGYDGAAPSGGGFDQDIRGGGMEGGSESYGSKGAMMPVESPPSNGKGYGGNGWNGARASYARPSYI
uniref:Glycine-rich protein n=1 Tax=Setaria digitata TaxID=48799 RepID=A0A915Q2T3_9BILA